MSRPATFTIHPEEGGRGDFSLAIGSERIAVVVVSDVVSQLLSMESELSMAGRPVETRGAPSIAPSGGLVDRPHRRSNWNRVLARVAG
jgi:hypothetical protein